MKIREASEKANEALDGAAARIERAKLTKWVLLALAIVLLIAVGLWFSKARATGYEHGFSGSTAIAGAAAGAAAGAVAGGGSATSGPVSVGGDSYSSRSYAFGAPGFANGALTCEAQIPVLGGTYERESCAILRDAAAAHAMNAGGDVVKEVLCNAPRIRAAFKTANKPCKSPEPERRW